MKLDMGQPTTGEGYVIVARELLPGVEALSTLPNIPSRAPALIAALAVECALKAFLWHRGLGKAILEHDVRHDLVALWGMAYKEQLGIPQDPPDWITILSSVHGPNFYLRYQEGKWDGKQKKTIVHGGQTPALIPMAVELRKLVQMVECNVKG